MQGWGLIVVDEEHEQAYKQEDQVVYHARDMAVLRARLESCPVVLATATPSLESWVNAGMVGDTPRYRRIALPKRIGLAQLPEIRAVDLRRTPPERGTWLAPPLVEAVNKRLEAGEQSLLAALDRLREQGRTLVLVSHRPALLKGADQLLVLRAGQMQAFGPAARVLQDLQQSARSAAQTAPVRRVAPALSISYGAQPGGQQ